MGVVQIDARLLDGGPAAIQAAIGERVGDPLLLRVEHDWRSAPAPDVVERAFEGVPALTLAVGAVPPALVTTFDLATPDPAQAERWEAGFARAPHAAVTAAMLLRDQPSKVSGASKVSGTPEVSGASRVSGAPEVWAASEVWSGLAAESAAYSMLLASPEFARWRAGHPARPADPGDADTPRVAVEHLGRVTRVTLVRGDRHNALDPRMRDELRTALADAAAGTGPVVVRGEGPSFCSGGDLDTFGSFPDPATAHVVRLARSVAWQAHLLAPRLIVGLHGACLGAGIEIPAFAAHVVAADDTRIGLPELGLGLIPGAGGTVSLTRRTSAARVLELLLGDGTIPAATARDWGLADETVPRAQLDARLLEIAESLP